MPNATWTVKTNVSLPMGMYRIVDSDPRTWACNALSRQCGFAHVWGH